MALEDRGHFSHELAEEMCRGHTRGATGAPRARRRNRTRPFGIRTPCVLPAQTPPSPHDFLENRVLGEQVTRIKELMTA